MSVDVQQLTAADFDEGMRFLDEVFGEHRPHDFASMLPSIYQPTDQHMACNHAVRVAGEIKAIVGLFPMDWQVGDTVLKVGGIGGVSTHPSVRGAGYMKVLMNHCVQSMKEQDFDLSWLGGQRQRYGYFGYEKCGMSAALHLTPANVRHALPTTSIDFESIESDDQTSLTFAHQLHETQTVYCQRPADPFYRYLISWYHRPHLARDQDGEPIGYLVADEEGGQVVELHAVDEAAALAMAGAWVSQREGSASFSVPMTATGLVQKLSAISEGLQISTSGNWQIFDWARTVEALLQVRSRTVALPAGEVRLGIEGYGTLDIVVDGDRIECHRRLTEVDETWSPFEAMRVLFGPLPSEAVVDMPPALALLGAWCPLPLGWPRQDGV